MSQRARLGLGIAVAAVILALAVLFVLREQGVVGRGGGGGSDVGGGSGGPPPPGAEDRIEFDLSQHVADADADDARVHGKVKHRAAPAFTARDDSPHGALVGRVFSWSTRMSIADAELAFIHDGVTHTLSTDEHGAFRFEPPSDGVWELATLTAEGYLPYAPELGNGGVRFVAREHMRIERADLFLFPAIDYVGKVVDADGAPVSGAEIELFGADSGERALIGLESSFRSDQDGEFTFNAPDFAVLEARHRERSGRAQLDGAAQISHTLTITLGQASSEAGEPITGRVLGFEEGTQVRAERAPGVGALVRTPITTVDEDGRFTLAPLDDSEYVLVAQIPGYIEIRSEVVEPGADVTLRANAGRRLQGRLVDELHRPIPTGTVALFAVDGLARRPIASVTVFDANGEFEFDRVTEGEYELQAIAQGYASAKPIRLEYPRPSGVIDVQLQTGAYLHGHVFDASTREPLPFAIVSADGLGVGHSVLPTLSSTVTDETGAFELYGLDSTRVSIEAVAFGHDTLTISGLELAPDQENGPIDFELVPVAEGERPKLEITGIGVEIAPAPDAILITNTIEGGGAEQAGLKSGDQITKVDGASVTELGFADAIQNIRGQEGTTVTLDITHEDGTKTTQEVERRRIQAG